MSAGAERVALEMCVAAFLIHGSDGVVLAQPNLIPHLPRRRTMSSLGVYEAGQPSADHVVLTREGNVWPFTADQIDGLIAGYQRDAAWEQTGHGPLFVFRRR